MNARQTPLSMDFKGKNTGVGCQFLFRGIFPIQRSNSSLLHCRQEQRICCFQGPRLLCCHLFSCWEQAFVLEGPTGRALAWEARLQEGLACGGAGSLELDP